MMRQLIRASQSIPKQSFTSRARARTHSTTTHFCPQRVTDNPFKVDISGLDKIKILQALFDKAQPLGMGYLHYDENQKLSEEDAQYILEKGDYAD